MEARDLLDAILGEFIQHTTNEGFAVEDSKGRVLESINFSRMGDRVVVLKFNDESEE